MRGGRTVKRLTVFLSVLILLACCCLPVSAAETGDDFPYICDTALLLSDSEWMSLEEQAAQISTLYQCAVYFITVDDYTYYGDGSIYEVAKTIYQTYDLGWGEERSGVLLLLSMYDRDYTLIAYGYGNTAFTDYGKDYLSEQFLDDFADDDWAGGCRDYLTTCGSLLKQARAGNPLDITSRIHTWHLVLISLVLGFAAALAICFFWQVRARKAVSRKTEAGQYLTQGGVQITQRDDRFSHTTQTRTKIEKSSGSSGGTTVDRQGFSGKSGKF